VELAGQMMSSRQSLCSEGISDCDPLSEGLAAKQTQAGISAHSHKVLESCKACKAAVSVLADIVVIDALKRPLSSTLVYVGRIVHNGVRITARILGPTRIDGGVILLTQITKGHCSSHQAYLLDDLYREMELNRRRTGCESELCELIEKAVARRSRILSTTTNYFSGITGKVMEIL
jgi:hypothetical protein